MVRLLHISATTVKSFKTLIILVIIGLIAINTYHFYKIVIVFTSDRFITLDAETLEIKLDDQELIDDKNTW